MEEGRAFDVGRSRGAPNAIAIGMDNRQIITCADSAMRCTRMAFMRRVASFMADEKGGVVESGGIS